MLISYPILETPQANDTEETVLARMLARATDAGGQYPAKSVEAYTLWHGGLHLDVDGATPIRAIADGTVVAYRQPQTREQYGGQPYDTGFVLIKHETETGEHTPVVFYSLYMHLACRDDLSQDRVGSLIPLFRQSAAIGTDAKSPPTGTAAERALAQVYRRDILGYSGLQYSQSNRRFHFEIFTTDEHLTRFWKNSSVATNQTASTDFYGDAHFVVPANKVFTARHPNAVQPHRIRLGVQHFYDLEVGQAGGCSDQLFVSVRLDKGRRIATTYVKQGESYRALGTGTAGTPVEQNDYEYELFRLASALYPDCASAGFEWLRFGRILSSDTTTNNQNWQLIRYSDGAVGYIDLAQADIVKLSDADFPFWRGWEKIEEGQLADPMDAFVDDQHALALLNDATDAGRQRLRHIVAKHPSEWDASDLATRYAKLRAAGKSLDNQDSWQAFEEHVRKMAFWDKTGGLDRSVWHFHPLVFIYHFRKCAWLSVREFAQCIPRRSLSGVTDWSTALERAQRHSVYYNKYLLKYCGASRSRIAHSLAQTYIETGKFRTMAEDGSGYNKPYGAFYGRGYHQLTWAGNFRDYGVYKNLPNQQHPTYIDPRITTTSVHLVGPGTDTMVWSPRYDPNVVATNLQHAADSSGFYWTSKSFRGKKNMNRVCDIEFNPSSVGFNCWLINGGNYGYADRQQFAKYLENVLFDSPPLSGVVSFRYPPLQPSSNPALCLSFPPATVPYTQNGSVNYERQIP